MINSSGLVNLIQVLEDLTNNYGHLDFSDIDNMKMLLNSLTSYDLKVIKNKYQFKEASILKIEGPDIKTQCLKVHYDEYDAAKMMYQNPNALRVLAENYLGAKVNWTVSRQFCSPITKLYPYLRYVLYDYVAPLDPSIYLLPETESKIINKWRTDVKILGFEQWAHRDDLIITNNGSEIYTILTDYNQIRVS